MLLVGPVEHTDVSQCIAIRVATLGSLVIGRPPPYLGYVQEAENSVHEDLDTSGHHVHHMKVVNHNNEGKVLAYAKWEIYPNGRPDLDKLARPMSGADKRVDKYGALREAANNYFSTRNGAMGRHPHIRSYYATIEHGEAIRLMRTVLALLVTSPTHQCRGAGSALVSWGVERSRALQLPLYTQASEQGRRLYLRHGFMATDTIDFDLETFGLSGTDRMTEMLRRCP